MYFDAEKRKRACYVQFVNKAFEVHHLHVNHCECSELSICGLIVGLPVTLMLIYTCFSPELHMDGFSAGMVVVCGGIIPILTTFYAIAEPD